MLARTGIALLRRHVRLRTAESCWNASGARRGVKQGRERPDLRQVLEDGTWDAIDKAKKLETLNIAAKFMGSDMVLEEKQRLDRHLLKLYDRRRAEIEEQLGPGLTFKVFSKWRREILSIDQRILKRVGSVTLKDCQNLLEHGYDASIDQHFVNALLRFAHTHFKSEYEEKLLESDYVTDLRGVHQLYPLARTKKRKIIYHYGPTNSGKTYMAMQSLKRCKRGVYAGPLRLLAVESFERLNRAGVYTSLRTGQEQREVPFATHISCTVEMLSHEEEYDVVVLDEIQLIGDSDRGDAWTRGVLGANAREVHVCGDPTALDLVRSLAEMCGDYFEAYEYKRRSQLITSQDSLGGNLSSLKEGDCVVAFSRAELFRLKHFVESTTKLRCCVVYGNLPPETRAQQARLFNDPESPYQVLIATDAVGMGLNLNIGRVIFTTTSKIVQAGVPPRKVPEPQIRQIAGRAGRDGTRFHTGYATCLYENDMQYFHEAMAGEHKPLMQAGLIPSVDQLTEFQSFEPSTGFALLLDKFCSVAKLEEKFFMCEQKIMIMKAVAELIENIPNLSLEERYAFCTAPLTLQMPTLVAEYQRVASEYANRGYCRLYANGKMPVSMMLFGRTIQTLGRAEAHCKYLDCYLYLAQHLGKAAFIDSEWAEAARNDLVQYIDTLLREARYVKPLDKRPQSSQAPASHVSRRDDSKELLKDKMDFDQAVVA